MKSIRVIWARTRRAIHQLRHLLPGGETWRHKPHRPVDVWIRGWKWPYSLVLDLLAPSYLACTCGRCFYPTHRQLIRVDYRCCKCQAKNAAYLLESQVGFHQGSCMWCLTEHRILVTEEYLNAKRATKRAHA